VSRIALLPRAFDGIPEPDPTDIAEDKRIFRRRAPWTQCFRIHRLTAGDAVRLERLGPRWGSLVVTTLRASAPRGGARNRYRLDIRDDTADSAARGVSNAVAARLRAAEWCGRR
jgi:hypothetical protein